SLAAVIAAPGKSIIVNEPPLSRKPWNFRSFDVLQLPTISLRALMPRAIVKSVPGQSMGLSINGLLTGLGTTLNAIIRTNENAPNILEAEPGDEFRLFMISPNAVFDQAEGVLTLHPRLCGGID